MEHKKPAALEPFCDRYNHPHKHKCPDRCQTTGCELIKISSISPHIKWHLRVQKLLSCLEDSTFRLIKKLTRGHTRRYKMKCCHGESGLSTQQAAWQSDPLSLALVWDLAWGALTPFLLRVCILGTCGRFSFSEWVRAYFGSSLSILFNWLCSSIFSTDNRTCNFIVERSAE